MTKKDLISSVTELLFSSNGYILSDKFEIWEYWYKIVGHTIFVSIKDRNDKREFKRLVESYSFVAPTFDNLPYNSAIELLYSHYPYGVSNSANSILTNDKDEILAIQWNWLEDNDYIISSMTAHPWYTILNNKKKIEYILKVSDLENKKLIHILNEIK